MQDEILTQCPRAIILTRIGQSGPPDGFGRGGAAVGEGPACFRVTARTKPRSPSLSAAECTSASRMASRCAPLIVSYPSACTCQGMEVCPAQMLALVAWHRAERLGRTRHVEQSMLNAYAGASIMQRFVPWIGGRHWMLLLGCGKRNINQCPSHTMPVKMGMHRVSESGEKVGDH